MSKPFFSTMQSINRDGFVFLIELIRLTKKPIGKFNLMCEMRSSTQQLNRYLASAIKYQLVDKQNKKYVITEKGRTFLKLIGDVDN